MDEYTRNADVVIKEQLHQLMQDFHHQLSRQFRKYMCHLNITKNGYKNGTSIIMVCPILRLSIIL